MSNTSTDRIAGARTQYRIFEEADGWHFCDVKLDYLDARGRGYPTKAAAKRAARETEESKRLLFESMKADHEAGKFNPDNAEDYIQKSAKTSPVKFRAGSPCF